MKYIFSGVVLFISFFSLSSLTSFAITQCIGQPVSITWTSSNCPGNSPSISAGPGSCTYNASPAAQNGGPLVIGTTPSSGSCSVSISCSGATTGSDTINVDTSATWNGSSCVPNVVEVYGACNNSSANTCTAGTPIAITPDGAGSVWYCAGTPNDAAHRSPQCSWQPAAEPNCSFPAGSVWGAACSSGTSLSTPYGQSGTVNNTNPAYTSASSITGTCSTGGNWINVTGSCVVAPAANSPAVTSLSFSPSTIAVGGTSVVSFTSSNATACYGTAGSIWQGNLSGVSTPPGGLSVPTAITNTAGTYSQGIYCTNDAGVTSPTVTANLTVGTPPTCNVVNDYYYNTGPCSGTCANGATNYSACTIFPTGDCPATTVTWGGGLCTGTSVAALNGGYTYALDQNSYTTVGAYVGSAQYTCSSAALIQDANQTANSQCQQVQCGVAGDSSGPLATCSGTCANRSTDYPSCPTPPGPDLIAGGGGIALNAVVGIPVNLVSYVLNRGINHTPAGFNNFFQNMSTTGILGSVINTPILLSGTSRTLSTAHTFTASDVSPTTGIATYFFRLCADKSSASDLGLITEVWEENNCGGGGALFVKACANDAINAGACNQCPVGLAWDAGTSTCIPCNYGGCTGTGGNPTTPLGSLVCRTGANNPTSCNQCPANLAWVRDPYSNRPQCVPCDNGGCTGTTGGRDSAPAGNLVCNNKPTLAAPPVCSYSLATPNPCYILDGQNTCTSVLTFASDPNQAVSPYAVTPTGTIGSGGTAVVDYGSNNFRLGGYTPDYSGNVTWGAIIIDGLCLVGSLFDTRFNTCISSGAPLPDLIASVTNTTSFATGQAQVVTAQITNIGNDDVVTPFPSFFQVATGLNGGGTVQDYASTTINSLLSAASQPAQRTFTFSTAQTGSMRVCANKSNSSIFGPVTEADPTNNCGTWVNFTVTGCTAPDIFDTVSNSCRNPTVLSLTATGQYYGPGSINFTCSDSNYYTLRNTDTGTVVSQGVYTIPRSIIVPSGVGTSANYGLICSYNTVLSAQSVVYYNSAPPPPPTPSLSASIPSINAKNTPVVLNWTIEHPTSACTLSSRTVCAKNICSEAQRAAATTLNTILLGKTDLNDPRGSRLIATTLTTIFPGDINFKTYGKKTVTLSRSTDFTLDCGSGNKVITRVRYTTNSEQ